jgi:hypothetical protein
MTAFLEETLASSPRSILRTGLGLFPKAVGPISSKGQAWLLEVDHCERKVAIVTLTLFPLFSLTYGANIGSKIEMNAIFY